MSAAEVNPTSVRDPDRRWHSPGAPRGEDDLAARADELIAEARAGGLVVAQRDEDRLVELLIVGRVEVADLAHRVLAAAESALAAGVRALCVISAGFAEAGAEGAERQDALLALVRDPDVRVLYPLTGVTKLLEVDEAEITRRYGIPGRAYGDFAGRATSDRNP